MDNPALLALLALSILLGLAGWALALRRRRSAAELAGLQMRHEQLEHQHWLLEQQSQRSALDLERRLLQMQTAAEITASIGRVLQPQQLLFEVVELVRSRFDLYYVGVFLVDAQREYAVLQAGSGEAGQRMLAGGHKLAVGGDSMIGQCVSTGRPRIAQDITLEARRFNNPHLAETRSELALPVASGEIVLGAMTVQSERPTAFDETDILVLQTITGTLASALQNARLFSEVQDNLQEIQALHRQYLSSSWREASGVQDGSLEYTFEGQAVSPARQTLKVPLVVRSQVIGDLELETASAQLTAEEQKLVETVAAQAALALENARLLEATQATAARERVINQMTAQISQSLDLDSVLKAAVRELGRLPQVVEVSVHVGAPDTDA